MKKLIIDLSTKTNSDTKYNDIIDYTSGVKSFDKLSTGYSLAKRSPEGSVDCGGAGKSLGAGAERNEKEDIEDRIESLMGEIDDYDITDN